MALRILCLAAIVLPYVDAFAPCTPGAIAASATRKLPSLMDRRGGRRSRGLAVPVHGRSFAKERGEGSRMLKMSSVKAESTDLWGDGSQEMTLGCLPFPPEDLLLPGETKTLHLYEARFLALFEQATSMDKSRCIQLLIGGNNGMEVVGIAGALEVDDWQPLPVGVSVTVRCVGRVRLTEISEFDPYIKATATRHYDAAPQGDAAIFQVGAMLEETIQVHDECVALSHRLRQGGEEDEGGQGGDEKDGMTWGHEPSELLLTKAFDKPLLEKVEECGIDLGYFQGGLGQPSPHCLEVITYAAAAGFDPSHRLWAFATTSASERLKETLPLLRERRGNLAAKLSLRTALGPSE